MTMHCISKSGCPVRGCEADGECYLFRCSHPHVPAPSRGGQRILVARFCLLGALALLALFFVGNLDFAADLELEAMEKEARPARVIAMHRELACDCTKMNAEREWLRFQIAHQPDQNACTVHCEYGRAQLIAEDL